MKNGQRRTLLEWFTAISPIAAAVAAVAAAYITYRIAPFAASLSQVANRVEAIETTYVEHGEIDVRLQDIANRLDRIENKLDRHLER